MKMEALFVVVLVACSSLAGASLPLPSYMKPCCVDQPNFELCCKKISEETLKNEIYKTGDPKYNIKSLHPLVIDKMAMPKGSVFNLELSNVKIFGLLDLEVKSMSNIRVPGQKRIMGECLFHNITLKGDYLLSGSLGMLGMNGKGKANIEMEGARTKYVIPLKDKIIDGKNHVIPGKITGSMNPSKMHVHFTNLFNGNKFMGDQMNLFLNDNWKDLLKATGPLLEIAISEAANAVMGGLSRSVAEEDFYPMTDCVRI